VSQEKTLSVLIIGAGMSGICMGIKLQERGINDFLIVEKSPDVGGTWYDNSYPGACCDVPSVLYSYSFEPNPNWSRKFSPQDEIQAYFSHCVDKYGLGGRIRLGTVIEGARYDEAEGIWTVQLEGGETLQTKCLISGLGQLNKPNIPEFAGVESFVGDAFHSARWRHDIDLNGKRVAVIGSAASALQFIPRVAEQVEQLTVYQRSANYIIARDDREYSAAEKARFRRYPLLQKLYRMMIYLRSEALLYPLMRAKSRLRSFFENGALKYMKEHISDPQLQRKFTPDFPAGCKRVLVSDDFFQAFTRPNVELLTSPITSISSRGVVSEDGIDRDVDVIIYGTGFKATEFLSGLDIYGRDGNSLKDAWAAGAEAYRGVSVSGFPNFFMLYGPNTNLGSNSIIFMVERQVNYIVRCVDKILSHKLNSLDVNHTAMRAYNDWMQGELGKTVWVASCHSWYKNEAGKVVNNWPHSTLAYWWHMRSPDFSDFDMRG
jgi:cation diffusion facilitator CzcD-associated flavoprotein CzcO